MAFGGRRCPPSQTTEDRTTDYNAQLSAHMALLKLTLSDLQRRGVRSASPSHAPARPRRRSSPAPALDPKGRTQLLGHGHKQVTTSHSATPGQSELRTGLGGAARTGGQAGGPTQRTPNSESLEILRGTAAATPTATPHPSINLMARGGSPTQQTGLEVMPNAVLHISFCSIAPPWVAPDHTA